MPGVTFGEVAFVEGVVDAFVGMVGDGPRHRLHAADVHGDDVFAALPAVCSQEHRHGVGMGVEFRCHVGARQFREAHFHIRIVGYRALATRHRDFAVLHEDDFRGRVRQHRLEQFRIGSAGHLVIDIALRERQERQRLGQRQR